MKLFLPFLTVLLLGAAPAQAKEGRDLRVRVGLGAQVIPDYVGAKDHRIFPLWDIDFAHGDDLFRFEAPDDSFGIPLIDKGGFAAGPAAKLESKREDSKVGAAVGKVPTTFEVGAFAQYDFGNSFRLRGDVRKGIGGQEGIVGSIGADAYWRDGDRYVFSIGPRLLFSDERYQRAFFGVSPAASLATGLPVYSPGGGPHAVAVASGLSYQFNPRFGMFGYARYERLIGDAANSPIIRQFGSRDQLSGGIGLSYTFIVKH